MNPLSYDNLDDRREIWKMLDRLSDKQRLAFLKLCSENCGDKLLSAKVVAGAKGEYTAYQAWMDLLALAFQYKLDLGWAASRLTGVVKKL